MKVVYIMGLWRSGSTLLDIVLGNHQSIESVGELRNLPIVGWNDEGLCACGVTARNCEYWERVRIRWTEKIGADRAKRLVDLQDRFERSRSLPRLLREHLWSSPAFREYGQMICALYETINEVSGKEVIVDSTKYPARAYALLQLPGVDPYLVHLVRDGRAIIWSCRRKPNTDLKGRAIHVDPATVARRTTLQWVQVNLICDLLLRLPSSRGVRVRYEDLVTTPSEVLGPIGRMLHLDTARLERDLASGREMKVGHTIAGNRMRMSGPVRLRPDLEWVEKLPAEDHRVFWRLAGWLARRYGYDAKKS